MSSLKLREVEKVYYNCCRSEFSKKIQLLLDTKLWFP